MSRNKPNQSRQYSYPAARKTDLSITRVGDETVVYDPLTHQASCLNAVTTVVWEASDGKSDINALLEAVRSAGFQEATEDVIWLALDQLEQAGLLEARQERSASSTRTLSRREMLRSIGTKAAIAIPVVSSISIQPAIAGNSCLAAGLPCTSGVECCSGNCTGVCV